MLGIFKRSLIFFPVSLFVALLMSSSLQAGGNEDIGKLTPVTVWHHFEDILNIPRPSLKEQAIAEHISLFAQDNQLFTSTDANGNVLVTKPASAGMEDRPAIILQSHMDMVTISNPGAEHDFDSDPIDAYIEDGFVKARGTTLGADNGIGMAYCMALLESKDIPHPALECLFTVDEESGMTGAKNLEEGLLKGKVLINLDSEHEQYLVTGCAGIKVIKSERTYDQQPIPSDCAACSVNISGFSGGHSADIHKQYGCANVLLIRLLNEFAKDNPIQLVSLRAGEKMNALAASGQAEIVLPANKVALLMQCGETEKQRLQDQFRDSEVEDADTISVVVTEILLPGFMLSASDSKHVLSTLAASRHGVIKHADGQLYPHTSCNLGIACLDQGVASATHMLRSCFGQDKEKYGAEIISHFEQAEWKTVIKEDTPVWQPLETSGIQVLICASYQTVLGFEPKILVEHGGLEPAVFVEKLPDVEMISLGPDIFDAHSLNERVNIESVGRIWRVLLHVLANIQASKE